jgi:hypothetical protein
MPLLIARPVTIFHFRHAFHYHAAALSMLAAAITPLMPLRRFVI